MLKIKKIMNNKYSNIPIIILAGGKGERLLPLTKNTPKPMLNIGTKPILEHNIDFLSQYGITQFHISVN